jgi:hypothetical protein
MKPSVLWSARLGWPPRAERLQAKLVARLQSTLVEKNEVIVVFKQKRYHFFSLVGIGWVVVGRVAGACVIGRSAVLRRQWAW